MIVIATTRRYMSIYTNPDPYFSGAVVHKVSFISPLSVIYWPTPYRFACKLFNPNTTSVRERKYKTPIGNPGKQGGFSKVIDDVPPLEIPGINHAHERDDRGGGLEVLRPVVGHGREHDRRRLVERGNQLPQVAQRRPHRRVEVVAQLVV